MASSSDSAGGGERGGGGGGGGGSPLNRTHHLQPVFKMTCPASSSASERSLSNRSGILLHHDNNRLIIVESADEEMRFIDDVTDSDSIDDDITTTTRAEAVNRDDDYLHSAQVMEQASTKHPLASSPSSAAAASNSFSSDHSEPLFENISSGNMHMATSYPGISRIQVSQPISDDKSSADGKRRISEPRFRNIFTSLHDKLIQQRKFDSSTIVKGSESQSGTSRKFSFGTPPLTKKHSVTPVIVRRQTNAARDIPHTNISSLASQATPATSEAEMSQHELAACANPKRASLLKRQTSVSSYDSKLSEGSYDRLEKDSEDAEDWKTSSESRSGPSMNESSTVPPGHPSPKQRHLLPFLRLHKDSTTSQQHRNNNMGQRFRHGSGGQLPETTSAFPSKDRPSTPTKPAPFSKKRGSFSVIDTSDNWVLAETMRQDQAFGLDKQRFAIPGEISLRQNSRAVGGEAAPVKANLTKVLSQETSTKAKDKNVFRSLIGRVRSMSISHDNSKVLVDINYTDSQTTGAQDEDEEAITPVPTGALPRFHRVSIEESASLGNNLARKSPPGKHRFSRESRSTQPYKDETGAQYRPRAHSVTVLRQPYALVNIPDAKKLHVTTDALDSAAALPAAAGARSKHIPAEINSRRKSSSLPDLLNPSEEEIRNLQAARQETDVVGLFLDEKRIVKLETGRRAVLPKESSEAQEKPMMMATSDSAAGPGADNAGVDPMQTYNKRRRSTLAEIAVNVFNRKTSTNPSKSHLKLFDAKRDISSRLKHLRLISENYEVNKLKQFYNENFSYIYYLFHEGFTAAEVVLSTKASRNPQREDMDFVLYTLEKILCVLPELINRRWQCHSLGQIMNKLLRCSTFQKDGMKFFIAWYSILMDNATENCDRIFKNLIPVSERGVELMQNSGSLCLCLEWILKCMVTEAAKVMWSNQEASFEFLFRKFYQYYILRFFPDFNATDLYSPSVDMLPQPLNQVTSQTSVVSDAYLSLQEVIIRWVTEFMQSSLSGMPAEKISFGIVPEKVPKDKPDLFSGACFQTSSPEGQKMYTEEEYAMVCTVFYLSQENVNIVLEILHQALLVSLHHSRIAKRVISVYKHWFQSRTKPAFMDEPSEPGTAKTLTDRNCPARSLNGCQRQGSSSSSSQSAFEGTEVAVGQQRVLQVFVTQSMVVFVRDWKILNQKLRESTSGLQLLTEQVDLCKATLGIYRYIAMNVYMTRQTWTYLLTALLQITSHILDSTLPKQKTKSLAGELASTLLQTLIVTWIRANLNFNVSKDLWNQLLSVLSSLTDWPEVIQEWANALEVLTTILANIVYSVDVKSLSADQTKDQKRRFVKKQHSQDAAEDIPKIQFDVVIGETNRYGHPPPRSNHSSIASLQQRRQQASASGAEHQPLQHHHHLPGMLMVRIPHSASPSVFPHDGSQHTLIRSASDSNICSPACTAIDRPLSDGQVIRLKSLESLDTDHEISIDPVWTLKKQHSTIADSNVTLRHVEETASLTKSPNNSCARAVGSSVDDDVQSRSSTLERISESSIGDNSPLPLYHLQPPVHASSPTSEDSMLPNDALVGQNGKRTDGICPASQNTTDLDSRKPVANMISLSSILEDGVSMASTESFNSDWYTSGTSEMTPDSSIAGATAYDSPSMSSSSADKNLRASTDSPSVSGGSPSLYKAGGREMQFSEDSSSVFFESEAEVQADDPNEDAGVACLSPKRGTVGWTPEVAELMWRRVLGLLGDVNSIEDAESHATVFDCLRIMTETLLKVHSNMTLQRVNQKTPPVLVIAPWVFQALTLPNRYLKGKVLAYRLLCLTMLQPYIEIPVKHLLRFYLVLHRGLVHSNSDIVNVLIKHCGSQFFLMPLEGATILLLDFIHAATGIITVSAGQNQAPTFEAMSLLGSLICFPNHFGQMSVLTPDIEDVTMTSVSDVYVKDCIINVLLSNSASRETSQLTSCIRVCALGIYAYEELRHGTIHSKVHDAVEAILDAVKESADQTVKLTSLDMLSLLTDHSQVLLSEFPDLPRVIIEDLVSFVEHCLLSSKKLPRTVNLKDLKNALFCILAWAMSVPVALLLSVCLSPRNPNDCLLSRIFNILQLQLTENSPPLNDPLQVDHNSNYQTVPSNARKNTEQAPSARLSRSDDKLASSETDLKMPDESSKTSHGYVAKETGFTLAPVAKAVHMHLLNYLGHYPMGHNGTRKLDSQVLECHDISNSDCLNVDILNRPDVQFLVWNDRLLISLNELPSDEMVDETGFSSVMATGNCRVIMRDISGKHCYDLTSLFVGSVQRSPFESDVCLTATSEGENHPDIISSTSTSRGSTDVASFPTKSVDLVDAILEDVSRTSPECRLYDGEFLNCVFPLPKNLPLKIDEIMLEFIEEQRNSEDDYLSSATDYDARCKAEPLLPGRLEPESNWPFQACRQFLSRMGYLVSENRSRIDLLRKSEQLIRDIRHLDSLICRETHKIAVIYVGGGQEDKATILSNEHGSQAYEDFIAGLGWKVSLEFHEGYMGGLQRNKTNGEMAVYFSTSTTEIMFHVSTIMPLSSDSDAHQKKVRHLGNDEVHIVWSDHHRRYHRNILNTEFADVIIVIYPIRSSLFHIQILKKPEIGFFGPLFDGAVVDSVVLPSLVRATALNASRTIRANKQHYKPFYEERDSCLKNIVMNHSELATREDFVSEILRPGLRHSATSVFPLNNQTSPLSHFQQFQVIRRKKLKPT